MGIQRIMWRTFAIAAIAMTLGGCGVVESFTELMKNGRAVDEALEQAVGVKPTTGFNLNNNYLIVTVQFPRPYDTKPLTELGDVVKVVVKREFKKTPNNIVLSFLLNN